MAIREKSSLDQVFYALGNGTRRKILEELGAQGEYRSAGELVEIFESSQPTISKHLRVLESAGLITRYVKGRHHFFGLASEPMQEAKDWMQRHFTLWQSSLERLEKFLEVEEED